MRQKVPKLPITDLSEQLLAATQEEDGRDSEDSTPTTRSPWHTPAIPTTAPLPVRRWWQRVRSVYSQVLRNKIPFLTFLGALPPPVPDGNSHKPDPCSQQEFGKGKPSWVHLYCDSEVSKS